MTYAVLTPSTGKLSKRIHVVVPTPHHMNPDLTLFRCGGWSVHTKTIDQPEWPDREKCPRCWPELRPTPDPKIRLRGHIEWFTGERYTRLALRRWLTANPGFFDVKPAAIDGRQQPEAA